MLRTAVKQAAAAVDRLHPPAPGLVVLLYHRVGRRTASAVDLPTDLFDQQMAHLAAHHRVVGLDEAADLLAGPRPPGPPPVVVTFDDGTADLVDEALPVLVRHRVPATAYLATDFVERGVDFPGDGRPLTWAAAAEAVASGLVTMGSHTHTHLLLDRVDPQVAAAELDRSVDLIGERLGVTATHFAYPKAVPATGVVAALVAARFRTATVAGTRPNRWGSSDLQRLHRSPVQVADGMAFFRRKLAGGMWLEDGARVAANRWRHRSATT